VETTQAASRQRFTAAAESIRETLDKASKIVGLLEAIAVNTPAAQPDVLTKLRIAKPGGPRVLEPADKPATGPAQLSAPTGKAA